jgi:hypothetical protein
MSKPKLIPFEVNWTISAAVPFLRLAITENEAAKIDFLAVFRTGTEQHDYRVKLRFEQPVWIRTTPAIIESTVINEDDYDWTYVMRPNINLDFDAWLQEFRRLWLQSGLCPDPSIYEVKDSPWLPSLGPEFQHLKHYLILGEDMMIEILGDKWTCEVGERIDWGRSS